MCVCVYECVPVCVGGKGCEGHSWYAYFQWMKFCYLFMMTPSHMLFDVTVAIHMGFELLAFDEDMLFVS